MIRRRVGLIFGCSLLLGAAACDLLAGIKDGTLVEAGTGPLHDGGADAHGKGDASHDATVATDGTTDGHVADAHVPDAHLVDAHPDAGPDAAPAPFACAAGTRQLVVSLEGADAGTFNTPGTTPPVFVAPTTVPNEYYVVAEPQSDGSGFSAFEVAPGQPIAPSTRTGAGDAGIALLDLLFARSGADVSIQALTTLTGRFTEFGPETDLQVVSLAPSFTLSTTPQPFLVSPGLLVNYYQGWLSAAVPNDAGNQAAWLGVTSGRAVIRYGLQIGEGPGEPEAGAPVNGFDAGVPLASITKPPFFAAAARYHVLLPGASPEAGIVEINASEDLAEAGAAGNILPPPGGGTWTILGAKQSVAAPNKVVVLLETTNASGELVPYGALVAAGNLHGLAVAPGGLSAGAPFSATNSATNAISNGWYDDDLVTTGVPSITHGMSILWLGPDGTIRAHGSSLFDDSRTVVSSAIQFDSYSLTAGSTFDVAWIESVTGGSATYQALYTAQVFCGPGVDGGS